MNILDKIITDKRIEVNLKKSILPVSQLKQSILFDRNTISIIDKLNNSKSGIIAEHKRRSPSKEVINQNLTCWEVAKGYEEAGVCGISVLTDGKYFGGSLDDLLTVRATVKLPVLRKEFIIDEYQLFEAKAYGADVILLIASVLKKEEIKQLSELAKTLGLEVLLEVHDEVELEKSIMPSIDMIGVNNRNLKTFEVNIDTSIQLANLIPHEFLKISESGIYEEIAIKELQKVGFKGFLIGENFMKTNSPGESASDFIRKIEL